MKKLRKTFAAVMLLCSLTITPPLLAQEETNTSRAVDRNDDDDTGKWGLLGLTGLLGLLAFRKKEDYNRTRTTTTTPRNP
jgi:hypothetical protein